MIKKENHINICLTKREEDVMRLVAQGFTNEEISKKLRISRHTVGDRVRVVLLKLDVNSRTRAVYLLTKFKYI